MACDMGKLKEIFDRGLAGDTGRFGGQLPIDVAIATASLDPRIYTPACVHPSVRAFAVGLGSYGWSTPRVRAEGMWPLAVAAVDAGCEMDRWRLRWALTYELQRSIGDGTRFRLMDILAQAVRTTPTGRLDYVLTEAAQCAVRAIETCRPRAISRFS